MKKHLISSLWLVLACLLFATAASAQNTRVEGNATDLEGKPMDGAKVIFKNQDNGQTVTLKTDKKGNFVAITIEPGNYNITLNKDGKDVYTAEKVHISFQGCCTPQGLKNGINELNFDMRKLAGPAPAPAGGGSGPGLDEAAKPNSKPQQPSGEVTADQKKKMAEAQQERAKAEAENKKIGNLNTLLKQAADADKANQYDVAVTTMKSASEAGATYPLVWGNLGSYELDWAKTGPDAATKTERYKQALTDTQKALDLCAENAKAQGCTPAQLANYHNNMGKGYGNTGDSQKALAEYDDAAKLDPSQAGQFFYNAGAILTNEASRQSTNEARAKYIDDANAAFDKAIAADPNRAVAYCEKGKNLLNKATTDKNGKFVAAPGTAEALNKCIELNPPGTYAEDAKQMLDALGESVTTNYKATKKK